MSTIKVLISNLNDFDNKDELVEEIKIKYKKVKFDHHDEENFIKAVSKLTSEFPKLKFILICGSSRRCGSDDQRILYRFKNGKLLNRHEFEYVDFYVEGINIGNSHIKYLEMYDFELENDITDEIIDDDMSPKLSNSCLLM